VKLLSGQLVGDSVSLRCYHNGEEREEDSMTIGERIKFLRAERGWTRRTLSSLTGFTEKAIADWEGGKYAPSERGIRALEKAFGERLRK